MKKFLITLAAFAALSAHAVVPGLPYEPFEANYPTYVLSDDSAANPQPFEANYPVQIEPMNVCTASYVLSDDSAANPQPFEANYPTYMLKCSNVNLAPDDYYPAAV